MWYKRGGWHEDDRLLNWNLFHSTPAAVFFQSFCSLPVTVVDWTDTAGSLRSGSKSVSPKSSCILWDNGAKIKTLVWSFKEQSLLLLHSGNFKTAKWQCDAPEEEYWECAAENKVTFVSDWLIDGSYFIVEQPVGHTALNGNLPHAETAVSENVARCQLWQYLCSHWGRVCVNLCPTSQSTGAFLLQTASSSFTSGSLLLRRNTKQL